VNESLWFLIYLQLVGWWRYLGRSVTTLKGAALAVVGLLIFVPWLLTVVFAPYSGAGLAPEVLRAQGPVYLLLYCLLNVLMSTGERAIYFTPAEVIFLFSGPFTRRQILTYKILSTFIISIPASLFVAVMVRVHSPWFVAAFVGLVLVFAFMQLFAMAINLLSIAVGERLFSRARKLVFGLIVLGLLAVLWQQGAFAGGWRYDEIMGHLTGNPVWQVVSWPLRIFFEVFLSDNILLLLWSVLAVGVVAAMLGMVFALDANYLEAAATSSARIYTQIQRIRSGAAVGLSAAPEGKVQWSLPMLPWLGGIGPNLWRQLTTALRSWGRLATLGFIFVAFLVAFLASPGVGSERGAAPEEMGIVLSILVLWMPAMFTTMIPYDFRGDIDRMAVLKSLPIPAWILVISQVLAPTLLIGLVQVLVLAALIVVRAYQSGFSGDAWLTPMTALAAISALFTLPVNFVIFAIENLLFLFFPSRLVATSGGDFQALGRNVLFMLGKLFMLGMILLAAFGVGLLVILVGEGVLHGDSMMAWAGGILAGWLVLAVSGLALVPMVAWAFQLFDVGRDTPA